MSFKQNKIRVIQSLESGFFSHEERDNIDEKNKLAVGDITKEEVVEILKKSRGNEYESSPHHHVKSIDVHIVVTKYKGQEWYIKWYFLEPDTIFISVH
ncbi:hypothetical protein ACU440_004504 [Vibrio alginolyticus]|uniref:hypothetical protein n=1 Tax=Vibrio TaxID=662 RepID=UPI0009F14C21|nr:MULTISPECIES: hypothetical protein [Vibrio]EKB1982651.1 hypothetical protein [Vibrio parahaemolyticus]EME0849445.1 hypothetical protein [Vibrio parahaemolyticus]MBM4805748.1 hypothetical protein [Vibrio parahaemolyticus]MCX8875170.1 hypothetical protein [Vibrio parahaemolyticus]MDW1827738.1 hypothetical protein [Vibrio sp. Vb0937]